MAGITFKQNNNSLSFNAPKEVVKAVEEVYVGNTAPTDDKYKIWVNPDEEEVTEVASKKYVDDAIDSIDFADVDLEGYATEEYVDKAIAEIELIPGEPGQPGEPGEDGYSPVRGRDYWTIEDKEAIVNDVLVALPAAEGVSV